MEFTPAYSPHRHATSSSGRRSADGRGAHAPHAAEVDRDAAFPWDGFKASVEMELPALGIPVAYGGAGADSVTQAIIGRGGSPECARRRA